MSLKLRSSRDDEHGISLILECDGNTTFSTHELSPRETTIATVQEIIEIIDEMGEHAKYKLWISHCTQEPEFLSIPYNWSAGCRWITNQYIRVDEDNAWFMDGGLCVITNSKAGLSRWKKCREMLCNTFHLNESKIHVSDDTKIYSCTCGREYLSRQGLHRHVTKMRDHKNHRRSDWGQ